MIVYHFLCGSRNGVDLLDDLVIQKISKKNGKSFAQILVQFQIQRNVMVIPKSVTSSQIRENIQVFLFDFELLENNVEELLRLDQNRWLATFPLTANHKDYPFHREYWKQLLSSSFVKRSPRLAAQIPLCKGCVVSSRNNNSRVRCKKNPDQSRGAILGES